MALAGIELEMLVCEPDALTTRPPSCANLAAVIQMQTAHYFDRLDLISAVKYMCPEFRTMNLI